MSSSLDRGLAFVLLGVLIAGPPIAQCGIDPETGQVRMLHLGKVWLRQGYPGPVLRAEPRVSWTPVPTYFTPDCVCHHATTYGERETRDMRTKLPRSRTDLVGNYDVVVIDAMFALDMPGPLAKWLAEAIDEEGMGFMMVDDEVTFAGRGLAPSWYLTPLGEVLPVDDQPDYYGWNERFEILPVSDDHPLTSGLDFSGVWVEANNRPTARPGSTTIATMGGGSAWNEGKPAIVYWDYGKGRSVAYIHRWHAQSGSFYDWKYHKDFICHLIYFCAGVPIPSDLALVHDTRDRFSKVEAGWQVLISTMDLADKFGANLHSVTRDLESLHDERKSAMREYIDQEFSQCLVSLSAIEDDLNSLTEAVIRLKNATMRWVFAIEWLTFSGTSMLAGFVLWELMIRKRVYSEVETTRLYQSG